MALAAELTAYFSTRTDVAFAVLFGSAVTGRQTIESDVDVAVYLLRAPAEPSARADTLGHQPARADTPPHASAPPVGPTDQHARASTTSPAQHPRTPIPDVETDHEFPSESGLWSDLERICGRNVDLVVLNRAAATVAAGALLTGELLIDTNPALYRKFFLTVTSLAEEEREFVTDYVAIKQRSRSLSEVDRARLLRIIDFLEDELQDYADFKDLDLKLYAGDRTMRRSVERWVENLVNASIDAAKIVLASERLPVPQTYAETLEMLAAVDGFWTGDAADAKETACQLARNTRVRNMLAHEYLDLRFAKVDQVVDHAHERYGALLAALRHWMG